MISFHLNVNPVAWQRARRCGNRYFTHQDSARFKNDIQSIILRRKELFSEFFNEAISLEVKFVFDRPKSVRRVFMTARPDIDNYLKALFDAFNGIVYKDDSQIVQLKASKEYKDTTSLKTGIYVKLTKLEVQNAANLHG